MKHTITNIPSPIRLLDYCKIELIGLLPSKNAIVKAIKREELLLNGKLTATGIYVKNGDVITLDKSNTETQHKVFELEIEIVFEDQYLAVINKPAGYDLSGNKFKTIQNALSHNLIKSDLEDALARPRPVHRLDNQTSGLLVVAKTQSSILHLSKQFENRTINKVYQCISIGTSSEEFNINSDIDDLKAETHFRTIEQLKHRFLGPLSLIEAKPISGRKHQIRKHLTELKLPILGDKIYGNHYTKGLFLFAKKINFVHPINNKALTFELELPNKFKTVIKHSNN